MTRISVTPGTLWAAWSWCAGGEYGSDAFSSRAHAERNSSSCRFNFISGILRVLGSTQRPSHTLVIGHPFLRRGIGLVRRPCYSSWPAPRFLAGSSARGFYLMLPDLLHWGVLRPPLGSGHTCRPRQVCGHEWLCRRHSSGPHPAPFP